MSREARRGNRGWHATATRLAWQYRHGCPSVAGVGVARARQACNKCSGPPHSAWPALAPSDITSLP
eukprot:scaffold258260_cov35-Tisochrysis_lutea.AAC.3